jgi:hypothetical protein
MFTPAVCGNATLNAESDERRDTMPQIIVRADRRDRHGEGPVMLKERVNVSDFESDHFAAQLVERLGWAVSDASEVEDTVEEPAPTVEEPAPQEHETSSVEEQRGRKPVHA